MAGGVRALLLKYAGDATSLKKTAKEIEGAHTQMGANLGTVSKDMGGNMNRLADAFGINVGAFKGLAGEGSKAFKGLAGAGGEAAGGIGEAGSSIAGLAGPIGIAIGAAVGIGVALKGAADVAASTAGEIRKLQGITGASAEDASRLRHEFVYFGVDLDAGGAGLIKFSKNLLESSDKFKQWFTVADLAKLKGQDLAADLPVLAAKYQSLGTALEKNTFLIDVFGKGGTALRPILAANADEIVRVGKEADKLGLTFGQKGLADAKAYTLAQRDLGEAFKGLTVTAGQSAMPAITNFIHAVVTGVEALRSINGWIEKVDHGLGGLGTILGGPIAWGMKAWHLVTGDNTKAQEDQRTAIEMQNAALEENAADMAKAAQEASAWADKVITSFGIIPSVVTGLDNMGKSQASSAKQTRQLADDQAHLNELRSAGVINTKALESAEKGIETSARAEESAQVALGKAVDTVATAQKKELDMLKALQAVMGGPSPQDEAKAEEEVGKAKIANTRASLSYTDALDAEQALKASGTATERQLLEASLAVQSARYGSVDAAGAEKTALQSLYDLQHQAEAGSVARVTAEDNYRLAHEAVTDALRAEADQERALRDAQLAQGEAAEALRKAQAPDEALVKGIAAAQRALADDLTTVDSVTHKVAISFADFKAQMIQQITDMTAWADNFKFLMEHKVSPAILEPLATLGPKAGPLLQVLRDEVVMHGTGTVNDLGANLTTAANQLDDVLQTFKHHYAEPISIEAKMSLTLDQSSLVAVSAAIGGAFPTPVSIKHFQMGGPVPGPIGSPQWAIVHGGETVFTPDQFNDLLAGIRSGGTASSVVAAGTLDARLEYHNHIYLDGTEIADNVTTHQLKRAARNVTVSRGLL